MISINKLENCSGCSACASVCPINCIAMEKDHEGFLYPHVDLKKCIDCNKCVTVCPVTNPILVETQKTKAFAVYNPDEEIRKNSSSGGVFTLLAEKILNDGGVVFGVAFSENFRSVQHIKVNTSEDLALLQGSKYLQSAVENSYIEAKICLEKGKPVLFTGTPCQIGGLKAFLEKDYPNLYTQDIICHGTPSPRVWEKYVGYRENEAMSDTRSVFFRHKKHGWKMYSVQFEFSNCTEYIQIFSKDLYMRGFLADLYLRPSCYQCAFKGLDRISDITLADFWGVNKLEPDMDDDMGTSLVLIHTEKGHQLFEELKEQLKYKPIDLASAIAANPAANKSANPHFKREYFFERFEKEPLPKLISDCLYESHCKRARNLSIRIFRKLKRALNFRRIQ